MPQECSIVNLSVKRFRSRMFLVAIEVDVLFAMLCLVGTLDGNLGKALVLM